MLCNGRFTGADMRIAIAKVLSCMMFSQLCIALASLEISHAAGLRQQLVQALPSSGWHTIFLSQLLQPGPSTMLIVNQFAAASLPQLPAWNISL